ncbi:hypothetical protein GOB07_06970 [Sinorhizobium meliloti]|nr:hypothetical protein [Sinorhizobium meliloti]MDW9535833.1 hypothetical protein [Sinorhizobium meliloti]MDW9667654.1 hypothetical protein [Sinorhizobium meliloti]MDW9766339.1 hypothetical protein [Sinorhizobium meliloti]MDW9988968.1 hypothetical protein [Sinorhizobium meliloti]
MKRRRLLFAWPRRSVPIFGSKFFGRCCLRASRPWPQEKEDVMSSIENNITPADLEMIRSVLDDAGYDASVLVEDRCLFDTAALLVTKLFLSGVDSPSALAAKLESQLGRAGTHRRSLSRYAIQGLPLESQANKS